MTKVKEAVNHPEHYNREGAMECIDEMILVFGVEETAIFCKLNAYKYRYRAGAKGDPTEDMKKSDWYMKKYTELVDGDIKETKYNPTEIAYKILVNIRDNKLDDTYIDDAIGYLGEAL